MAYDQALTDLLALLTETDPKNHAKEWNKIISEHGLCDIITFAKQN